MTLQEYKDKLQEIKNETTKKEQTLAIEYAKANNPYKVGDIVTDHIGSVIVEKMNYTITLNNIPCVVYVGSELSKDGTKKKKNSVRNVYQTNLR
jgi:vacuolar-type H+-ATPase subunit F/Vma7